jgi:hypothetical protein
MALGVVALAVVIGVVAYATLRSSPVVMVAGDSVTFQSQGQIREAFGGDVTVDLVAFPGLTSTVLLPYVEDAVARRQRDDGHLGRAVFLVGYNDVLIGDVRSPDLDRLIELSAGFECAVWLLLHTSATLDATKVATWNERITTLASTHPNLHVVTAWAEAAQADPLALIVSDGVHPSPAGQARLAEVVASSVDASCGPA